MIHLVIRLPSRKGVIKSVFFRQSKWRPVDHESDALTTEPTMSVVLCCVTGECVQRSCSDLRSAERLTASTNVRCDRDLIIPRLHSSAACWSLNPATAARAAIVEIIRSPSDPLGPPWTDSAVRRTKDTAATVSRRTCSFAADGNPPPGQPVPAAEGPDRKCRRRRGAASSATSQDPDAQSASTVRSTDDAGSRRRHQQMSLDYDDDVTDDRMTSEVTTSSSPPTVNATERLQ